MVCLCDVEDHVLVLKSNNVSSHNNPRSKPLSQSESNLLMKYYSLRNKLTAYSLPVVRFLGGGGCGELWRNLYLVCNFVHFHGIPKSESYGLKIRVFLSLFLYYGLALLEGDKMFHSCWLQDCEVFLLEIYISEHKPLISWCCIIEFVVCISVKIVGYHFLFIWSRCEIDITNIAVNLSSHYNFHTVT